MPREGKTSITVNDETLDYVKGVKPDGVTWDYFLRQAANAWDAAGDR